MRLLAVYSKKWKLTQEERLRHRCCAVFLIGMDDGDSIINDGKSAEELGLLIGCFWKTRKETACVRDFGEHWDKRSGFCLGTIFLWKWPRSGFAVHVMPRILSFDRCESLLSHCWTSCKPAIAVLPYIVRSCGPSALDSGLDAADAHSASSAAHHRISPKYFLSCLSQVCTDCDKLPHSVVLKSHWVNCALISCSRQAILWTQVWCITGFQKLRKPYSCDCRLVCVSCISSALRVVIIGWHVFLLAQFWYLCYMPATVEFFLEEGLSDMNPIGLALQKQGKPVLSHTNVCWFIALLKTVACLYANGVRFVYFASLVV